MWKQLKTKTKFCGGEGFGFCSFVFSLGAHYFKENLSIILIAVAQRKAPQGPAKIRTGTFNDMYTV
jgi:hypothetical protein